MPSQALLQVLRREHVEDLHRLAGIEREAAQARHAIEDRRCAVRHRLPWLLVGLAGSALATAAMAAFESTLSSTIAVAFFVPGIVYLADAIGTQTEAIAVRRLSLTHAGLVRLLAGELRTGMLLGAILGLVSFFPVWLLFGGPRLAAAVATAIFAAGTIAAGLGLLLLVDRAYGPRPGVRQRPACHGDPGRPEPPRLSRRGARLRRIGMDVPHGKETRPDEPPSGTREPGSLRAG